MAKDKELRRAQLKEAAIMRAEQQLRNNFATTDNKLDNIEPRMRELEKLHEQGLLTTVEVSPDVFEIEAG